MSTKSVGARLNEQLDAIGEKTLDEATVGRFEAYISLFVRWSERLNLSSVRDEDGILSRHLVESIVVARALPTEVHTLLDFGSGAGLPGIPIALCRPGIAVTLAESQGKKAAFLQEAVRVVGLNATVHSGRAETVQTAFDCVILRAVDKMPKAVAAAAGMVAPKGWLALMTTDAELGRLREAAGASFSWAAPVRLPGSESRSLALGQKVSSST